MARIVTHGVPPGITAPPGSFAAFVWGEGRFECVQSRPRSLPRLVVAFGYPRSRRPRLELDLPPVGDTYLGWPRSYEPTRGTGPVRREELREKYALVLDYGIAAAQLLAVKRVAQEYGHAIPFLLEQKETPSSGIIDGPVMLTGVEPYPFTFYRMIAEQLGWKHRYEWEHRPDETDETHALMVQVPPNGFDARAWFR